MVEPSRHHPRYEIETEVLYKVETPPQTAKGVCSRNLSEGGLLLEGDEFLPPGTRLDLILIRAKRGTIECQGEVVWAEDPRPKAGFRHGIRITRMDPPQQVAWERFLAEASRELGRRPLRLDIDIPLSCRLPDREERWQGRALNVSRGGFLVRLPVQLPEGTVLSLEVESPTQNLKTDARVVRVQEPGEDGLVPHGLAFVNAEDGARFLPALFLLGLLQ
jgi:hypothetical protein